MTSGSGRVVFGTTWRSTSFTRLDGRDLQDEGLVTTANRFRDEPAPFDVERLTFTLRSSIVTGFATVGLTITSISPWRCLTCGSTSTARASTRTGTSVLQAQATASSTGLGDVAVRGKYHFLDRGALRLAAAGEVTLPTGREEDFLGAGRVATRVMGVASIEQGVHRPARHLRRGMGWRVRRDRLRRCAHGGRRATCHDRGGADGTPPGRHRPDW